MKKFREFKSQQQVVNEIGPVGAVMAAAMGIVGGAMAVKKGLDNLKVIGRIEQTKSLGKRMALI